MTWNYRVFKKTYVSPSGETSFYYVVHEVYYEGEVIDDNIKCVTKESSVPFGDTEKELKQDLKYMAQAFKRPTIDYQALCKKKGWQE